MSEAKLANRPAGLHELLRNRWSPRAFSSKPIAADTVTRLLEAAQWAMSSYNGQPWRIVYATKDDAAAYDRILSTLVPFNQSWANSAALIGISIGRTHFEHNGEPNHWSAYDTGAAMATAKMVLGMVSARLSITLYNLLIQRTRNVSLSPPPFFIKKTHSTGTRVSEKSNDPINAEVMV